MYFLGNARLPQTPGPSTYEGESSAVQRLGDSSFTGSTRTRSTGWEREGEDYDYFRGFSPQAYALGIKLVLYSRSH